MSSRKRVEVGCCLIQFLAINRLAGSIPLILYAGEDEFDEAH